MYHWPEVATRRWFFGICVLISLCGLWFNTEAYVCPVPGGLPASEASYKPPCLEFWLNRYQTLVGAGLALIAAWIATIPARGQLREMSRQSSASARESAKDRAQDIEAEIALATECYILARTIESQFDPFKDMAIWEKIHLDWPVAWLETFGNLKGKITRLNVLLRRSAQSGSLWEERVQMLASAELVRATVLDAADVFRRFTSVVDYENGETDATYIDHAAVVHAMERYLPQWIQRINIQRDLLKQKLNETWIVVQKLEDEAIGQ